MKKLFLIPFLVLVASFSSAQETGFRAGVHLGVPVGNASDYSNFNIGLDASYFFWQPVENLNLGVATGYTHYVGKSRNYYNGDDFGYIPIAAAGEYSFTPSFYVGTDVGFAIATESYWDSGFYFQPKVGWNVDDFKLFAFMKGITSNKTLTTIGVGGAYKF